MCAHKSLDDFKSTKTFLYAIYLLHVKPNATIRRDDPIAGAMRATLQHASRSETTTEREKKRYGECGRGRKRENALNERNRLGWTTKIHNQLDGFSIRSENL